MLQKMEYLTSEVNFSKLLTYSTGQLLILKQAMGFQIKMIV